ncbi:MAG: ATP-binding protein [Coriobacteriales bacterium]|jgi:signal transduction histidine kinase
MKIRTRLKDWRTWLVGSYVLIIAAIAALWGYSLFAPIDKAEESQQYDSLQSIANATGVVLATSNLDASDAIHRLDEGGDIRITVITKNGEVIADSKDDAATMENHLNRPEVQAALSGEVGRDRRVSSTDGVEYLYVAISTNYNKHTVVVRASTPVSEANSMAQGFRNTGIVLLIVTLILSIVIGWFAFSKTTKPVSKLERVRTDFVANASHELKTPVAGIQLLAESIDNAYQDGDYDLIPMFTARLKKEGERLQNLVTDLLDLSRLENGGLSGRANGTCDLASIVGTSYDAHNEQARAKGIEFIYHDDVASNDRCRVNLSPTDASLLVDNLIENAINYTEEGSVDITLSTKPGAVVLEVSDTGIGIPAIDQERIFERFYRCDTARSREMGGTGLGLSLVRHAVNQAKGHITLDSTPGRGSTFTIELPKA